MVIVPSQACLHGDGNLYCIHHGAGNFQHQRNILQHACACSFACDALHGAAEVNVQNVRTCFFHYLGGLYHCCRIFSVNLDGYGAFFVIDVQLLHGFPYRTYQGIGRHEFGIYHVGTELFAHQAESRVGHILHRS